MTSSDGITGGTRLTIQDSEDTVKSNHNPKGKYKLSARQHEPRKNAQLMRE
jgi:hypothetical protein